MTREQFEAHRLAAFWREVETYLAFWAIVKGE